MINLKTGSLTKKKITSNWALLSLFLICNLPSLSTVIFAQNNLQHQKQRLAIIWDGDAISPWHIEKIANLRSKILGISVIHFLSPAYLQQNDKLADLQRSLLKSQLQPQDEIGLYWDFGYTKSMNSTEQKSSSYIDFWTSSSVAKDLCEDQTPCKSEISLSHEAFDPNVQTKLLQDTIELFEIHKFAKPDYLQWGSTPFKTEYISSSLISGFSNIVVAAPSNGLKRRFRSLQIWHDQAILTEVDRGYQICKDYKWEQNTLNHERQIRCLLNQSMGSSSFQDDLKLVSTSEEPIIFSISFQSISALSSRIEELFLNFKS